MKYNKMEKTEFVKSEKEKKCLFIKSKGGTKENLERKISLPTSIHTNSHIPLTTACIFLLFDLVSLFNDISTFMVYLMPKPSF